MGWLVGWDSKKDVVEHLKRQVGERLVRAAVVGRVLWTVEKTDLPPGSFIGCYLLDGGRGPGISDPRWGYKDICESMGPAEVTCPLAYLEMVPPPGGEYAAGWRERVRRYHAERAERSAAGRTAQPGDEVVLCEGCKPGRLTVLSKHGAGLRCRGPDGRVYRVATRLVASVEHQGAGGSGLRIVEV